MTNIQRAFYAAERAHTGQTYDIYPYMYHIKQTYDIAKMFAFDEDIVVACILHDTLEDGRLSYNDIKRGFGQNVAEIVYCVTDELGRNRVERKQKTYPKIKSNRKAIAVKLCDRIANVQHSHVHSQKMFNTYKNEHQEFLQLRTDDEELENAWFFLETLFK